MHLARGGAHSAGFPPKGALISPEVHIQPACRLTRCLISLLNLLSCNQSSIKVNDNDIYDTFKSRYNSN